jgi:pilus assembly protein CpaE
MPKDVLRVAFVDPSDSTREPLRALLLGLESVWLEAEGNRYDFFPDVVSQSHPDLALVSLDADPNRALALIAQLKQNMPGMAILAVSSRTDGPFILQTLRQGADEFLTQPLVLEELLTVMQRIQQRVTEKSGPASGPGGVATPSPMPGARSMVLAVAGSRGGIGCTSIAVNLGCALARDKANTVVLVDLDLALGDADVILDLPPSTTLSDIASNIDRLDLAFLRNALSKHSSGLALLPHPVQLDDVAMIHEEHLQRVVNLLKASYTHIILDLSKSYRPTDLMALRMADSVLMVAQLELTSIRNVFQLLRSLNNVEGLTDKIKIVMNRVGADDQEITEKRAEEAIGRPIFWKVPNDSKTMLASRNAGKPLVEYAPRSKVLMAIQSLADALCGKPVDTKQSKKSGWFS